LEKIFVLKIIIFFLKKKKLFPSDKKNAKFNYSINSLIWTRKITYFCYFCISNNTVATGKKKKRGKNKRKERTIAVKTQCYMCHLYNTGNCFFASGNILTQTDSALWVCENEMSCLFFFSYRFLSIFNITIDQYFMQQPEAERERERERENWCLA
jgi:hypothetical protein